MSDTPTTSHFLDEETFRAAQLASLGELAAGVAHEINNPLNVVISYAELLLDDVPEGGASREFVTEIIDQSKRISAIVNSLLSLSKGQKEEMRSLDLASVLDETLHLIKSQMEKEGIRFDIGAGEGLWRVMGREHELQQVFINLLSNARYALNAKYSSYDPGKIMLIRIHSFDIKGKSFVQVMFEDAGKGIPDKVRERMFEPFYTTKPRNEGTGLGLSISRKIVAGHGGFIDVQSEPGCFTRLCVNLPMAEGKE